MDKLIYKFQNNKEYSYNSTQKTHFKINGIVLSDSVTNLIVKQKKIESKEDDIIVEFNIHDLINKGGLEQIQDIINFAGRIEKISHRLVLYIDNKGEIIKVINQPELNEKWKLFKNDLSNDDVFNTIPTDNQKNIINQGDLEYSLEYPYQDGIKNSIVFYNLIYPFYGMHFSEEQNIQKFQSKRFSSVIKNVLVTFDNEATYYMIDDDFIELRVNSKYDETIDLNELEVELKNNFPNFPNRIKSYKHSISHNYILHKKTNAIVNSEIIVHENIDDVFEVIIQHKLNLVTNE